jgi:hypothetical protein
MAALAAMLHRGTRLRLFEAALVPKRPAANPRQRHQGQPTSRNSGPAGPRLMQRNCRTIATLFIASTSTLEAL